MKRFLIALLLLASPIYAAGENLDSVVSVVSTAGGTVVVSANAKRLNLCLQNVDIVTVYCSKGVNVPTVTNYGFVLKADSGANAGTALPVCFYGPLGHVIYQFTCIAASGTARVARSTSGN